MGNLACADISNSTSKNGKKIIYLISNCTQQQPDKIYTDQIKADHIKIN